MIILNIDKPQNCTECPMHIDCTDYCRLEHELACLVRGKGCPIQTVDAIPLSVIKEIRAEIMSKDGLEDVLEIIDRKLKEYTP